MVPSNYLLGGKLVRRFDLDVVLLLDDDSLLDKSERGSEGRVNYSEKIRGVLQAGERDRFVNSPPRSTHAGVNNSLFWV